MVHRHSTRLLAELCQPDNLTRAWKRYKRHVGLWAPGTSMALVARDPVGPMLEVAAELRTGRYQPYPPTHIQIAKADGGRRTISVYMLRDRVVQRAALQVLERRTEPAMSPASFGYRVGRGVASALKCVRALIDGGRPWVDRIPGVRRMRGVAIRLVPRGW